MFLFLFQLPARRSPSETKVQLEPAPPVHLFKVGWDLLIVYRPGPSLPSTGVHHRTAQHSTAKQSRSTGRAGAAVAGAAASASVPIKTSPQTCPASILSPLPLDGPDDVLCLFALHSIAFCIVSHCVAVARQSVSVSGSFLPDRYTLGAHHNPISYPPCLFYLSPISPQFASPPYITPLDAISQSQTLLRLSPSLLYITLCPSFSYALSAVNSEPLHLTHPITRSSWSLINSRPKPPLQ